MKANDIIENLKTMIRSMTANNAEPRIVSFSTLYLEEIIRGYEKQQVEIERLQDIIISNAEERLSSSAIMMKKEKELMHAEHISGLEAEIERLKKNLNDVSKCNINLMYRMDKAKSEVRKEFWEKLKQKKYGGTYPYVLITEGDNLLKEMEGK